MNRRKMAHLSAVAITVSFIIASCSKSNEASLKNSSGGTDNCDTVNMTFAADIVPILQANCYSCHGNGLSQNGVSLDSYDQVKTQADNGNLIHVINHAPGYPAMPQGAPKLSDCTINKIKDWVDRGALNN